MNWFEEQLRNREKSENADFDDAIDSIASAVMGSRLRNALSKNDVAASAIEEILKYYHCTVKENKLPPKIKTVDEQIEYLMQPFGIKSRGVVLDQGWYRHAVGAMLGTLKEDGSAVALLPGKAAGYWLLDIKTGRKLRLNQKTEKLIDKEAVCFYEPMPQKKLSTGSFLKYMFQQISVLDMILYIVLIALSAVLGMLAPFFTKWLFGNVLESGSMQMLLSLAVFAFCFSIARFCFHSFQGLINSRIGVKQNVAVQAALMNRIISLSPDFFRKYSSGNLAQRFASFQELCISFFSSIGTIGLSSLFSLIYISEIFAFAPSLALPASIIIVSMIVVLTVVIFRQTKITQEKMEVSAKTSGISFATILGIQKIKQAGAEKRMFSRWGRQYAKQAKLEYDPPLFLKMIKTVPLAISLGGTIILYEEAVRNHMAVDDYFAFNTAFAMVSAALTSVVTIIPALANIKPALEMIKPIIETEPEIHSRKENISELSGSIELSHVSFRYNDTTPNVIDDLSLKIAPGEFLAIVGSTGCGKSTLMRLLLGFEAPQKGSIYFDRRDISGIDSGSLRRNIGTVMQNSKLFLGDIYSNIVISAPHLTMDDAWEAAEIASIADDIRDMPMGMYTHISEGQGGISGGQKQRLMIARAVVSKPKILMFDEATSALDNITQKKVAEAIAGLKCTRIVIAHRLSTIQHADRIVFLEHGKIVEEGTYQELISKNGYFAKLVERQRLETEDCENQTGFCKR